MSKHMLIHPAGTATPVHHHDLHNEGSLSDPDEGFKLVRSRAPLDLGAFPNQAEEFQHVVYMPIKPREYAYFRRLDLPEHLDWAFPLLQAVSAHIGPQPRYVYLTVRHHWVEAGTAGNREGWHIDGYGSPGDRNFIWCSSVPTEYVEGNLWLPEDHADCLALLAAIPEGDLVQTLKPYHLYELGDVVHRCALAKESGMRTFVKISVSSEKYDLLGNARNPLLPSTHWPLKPREGVRNHPTAQPGGGKALPDHRAERKEGQTVVLAGPFGAAIHHNVGPETLKAIKEGS